MNPLLCSASAHGITAQIMPQDHQPSIEINQDTKIVQVALRDLQAPGSTVWIKHKQDGTLEALFNQRPPIEQLGNVGGIAADPEFSRQYHIGFSSVLNPPSLLICNYRPPAHQLRPEESKHTVVDYGNASLPKSLYEQAKAVSGFWTQEQYKKASPFAGDRKPSGYLIRPASDFDPKDNTQCKLTLEYYNAGSAQGKRIAILGKNRRWGCPQLPQPILFTNLENLIGRLEDVKGLNPISPKAIPRVIQGSGDDKEVP